MPKKRLIFLLFLLSIPFVVGAQTKPSWSQIKNTPTTVDGYGITDALKSDLSNATASVDADGAGKFRKALRLSDSSFVDVTDFGAVPDDYQDDYAAFMAAVSSLADGSTLRIPPGIYYTSDSIHINGKNDLVIECQGRIAPDGANVELVRITGGRGVVGNLRLGVLGEVYGAQTSVVALGNLNSANLLLNFEGYSGAATQTVYLFTNPNSVITIDGTTHYCDEIGNIAISIGSDGFSGPISTDKLDKLHFLGDDLSLAGSLNVASGVYTSDLSVSAGNISVTGGNIFTDQVLSVGQHAQITGLLYADGGVRGNIEATNATITNLLLAYNNNLNIATATINRLTSPAITAGNISASGQVSGNQVIASSGVFDTLQAQTISASSTHYENLSAGQITASSATILNASATVLEAEDFQADEAIIASATLNRLLVETPIQAPAGIEFGDRILMNTRPLGRNIEHSSESAGIRLATGSVSLTADDPDNPSMTISSFAVNSSGTVTVYGQHFVVGADTASFPADVSMANRLKVGGLDYGSLSTYDFDAYRISSPYASHTQRLSALRLNFLSSLTHEDIPGSFITAHPTTGAVQHFFNNAMLLSLGVAGVTVSDFKVTGEVAPPLDFGGAGKIALGQWDVGDGNTNLNLVVASGSLFVYGPGEFSTIEADAASASNLIASQASIASASITRLEVDELIAVLPPATAPALLASSTASASLPIAFQDPSYPHDRSLDSGIYSPGYGQLAFWIDDPTAKLPWLRMYFTGGEFSESVNSITRPSDAASGITYSGGTLSGGGVIYLGNNSAPYCQIRNGSKEMITTYGDIVRVGTIDWDDNYLLLVGGQTLIDGRADVTGGLNLSRSSPPAGAKNGDIYYDSTTHKFRGYADGSWVDLN